MPNHTVSTNVDTMLRAADNAAIRSAIGLGQTDAPTFLGVNINASGVTPESGMAWSGSNHLAFFHNSTLRMVLLSTGTTIGSDMAYSWGSAGIPTSASRDLILTRDAAGILAQRNGATPQAFRVYNTYTDASNHERLDLGWVSNVARIHATKGGTGSARSLAIIATSALEFWTGDTRRWNFDLNGHFVAQTDNLYDIGASGANRPRDIYSGRNCIVSGYLAPFGPIYVGGTTGAATTIVSSSQGVLKIANNPQDDFNRLQLGGTTDAFPSIARDGAGIKFTGAAAGSTSWIKVPAVAVSALPAAATAGVGARAFVNDALSPVFGSAVTGGGAVTVPVYSTGSAWNVG